MYLVTSLVHLSCRLVSNVQCSSCAYRLIYSNHLVTLLTMELVRIDGRYRLQRKVWSGPYSKSEVTASHPSSLIVDYTGEVYLAHDILSGQDVVLKLEPIHSKHCVLEHEFHVYEKLGQGISIPRVRWFGTEAGFNVMAIDRLGLSLEDIFLRCHFQFSVKTVLLLAGQLVSPSICRPRLMC